MFYVLLVTHVLLTTAGYAGLIATNVSLLFAGSSDTWRKSVRVFGPMLGIGVVFGFGLAAMLHVPLGSTWLVVTYGLVIAAFGIQAGVMVPWQSRSRRSLAAGALPSPAPARIVVATLGIAYTAIIGLMIVRPG